MTVLRERIGEVLRAARQQQGRTLREISTDAQVSLGYISEVERGQKEASSELLAALCDALRVPMSVVLREVSDRLEAEERAARAASGVREIGSVSVPRAATSSGEVVAAA